MHVPPLPRPTGGRFFEAYTRGLTTADLERLFTRDAPEAYRFFSRNVDFDELKDRPWHLRILGRARLLFLAFTLKLTPARRVLYVRKREELPREADVVRAAARHVGIKFVVSADSRSVTIAL